MSLTTLATLGVSAVRKAAMNHVHQEVFIVLGPVESTRSFIENPMRIFHFCKEASGIV